MSKNQLKGVNIEKKVKKMQRKVEFDLKNARFGVKFRMRKVTNIKIYAINPRKTYEKNRDAIGHI